MDPPIWPRLARRPWTQFKDDPAADATIAAAVTAIERGPAQRSGPAIERQGFGDSPVLKTGKAM
jgi:hypothetical protein